MCEADGDGPYGSEVRMESGEEKANGEEGTEDEVWTGEGGGAVRETEEGEAVMAWSRNARLTGFCSALGER